MKIINEKSEMRNNYGGKVLSFIFVIFALLFVSCPDVFELPNIADNAERGTLSLGIGRQETGRAILPSTALDDFVKFDLDFTARSAVNSSFSETWTSSSGTVILDAGTWDISVTAYLDDGNGGFLEAAKGKLEGIAIPSGNLIAANIVLTPIAAGQGTFSWDINYPANVAAASMEITRLDNTSYNETFYFIGSGTIVGKNGNLILNAGEYRVVFKLSNGEEEASLSEILHIYQNMESSYTQIFTEAHFPVTLTKIILDAWDNSSMQWKFIERGITAGHFLWLDINGIVNSNFDNIIRWFNSICSGGSAPQNLNQLRILSDAALIGIASEDDAFLNAGNYTFQSDAAAAVEALAINGSSVIHVWAADNKTLTIQIFEKNITFVFSAAISTSVQYGNFNIFTADFSGVSYTNNILTISFGGSYTIGLRPGLASTEAERIVVNSGVTANITLSGVNINRSSTGGRAFDMTGATVNLTLVGANTLRSGSGNAGLQAPAGSTLVITEESTGSLTATGGDSGGAGIGGGNGAAGGNIIINGGILTATGGSSGAGIGGGGSGAGGNISIADGTVTATGGSSGAGIGGGGSGAGGSISITGGTITAAGGSSGWGIGSGTGTNGGTISTISGNAVIFASSIQPALPTGANIGPAVIFDSNIGTVHGNVNIARNITIPSGRNLIITGLTLNIQNGYTLANNGAIYLEDGGNVIGTIIGNQPITMEPSFSISGDSAYTYFAGILTFTGNGTYNISMRSGITTTTVDRIVVSPGVTANITLSDISINMSGNNRICAFDMTNASINLTLVGSNTLRSGSGRAGLEAPSGATLVIMEASTGSLAATGGSNGAGIGGGSGSAGGNITINGGTITATGGSSSAGIGGGSSGAGGNISITDGTITSTGGSSGAGIGGGGSGAGAALSISGGTITAAGGSSGSGIGSGTGSNGGIINTIGGNAVVFASSIQPALPAGGSLGSAVIFNDNLGTMYGNVSLSRNVTIPSGRILSVTNGQTLTIQNGNMLTNNGTIIIDIGGSVIGTIIGNQPTESSLTVSGDSAYSYSGGTLTITGNGSYIIGMRTGVTSTTVDRIVVASGVTANITLSGVNINRSSTGGSAFDMTGATVNITLVGTNTLRSGGIGAGIDVPSGSTLVITEESTGSLAATGASGGTSSGGAGIGGGYNQTGGNIIINGGMVTATGGTYGAGIGGGYRQTGGNIMINGGTIIAIGGNSATGIGGGASSSVNSTITITNGAVNVTSGFAGVGIRGTINITNGTVNVTSGGSNSTGISGTISITGGTITSTGGGTGYGIGSGTISTITGNAVIFASSIQPALPTGVNLGPAIVFNGNTGAMYGNVSLARNVTIPSGRSLLIEDSQTLTIQNGFSLTNNGTIYLENGGNIIGTVLGNQPIDPSLPPVVESPFTVSGSSAYTYTTGILTITGDGTYNIGMGAGITSTTADRIAVNSGVTANINLSDVNINRSSTGGIAFNMTGATVNLTLAGDNTLRSGSNSAGIQAPAGSTLVITAASTGSLTAAGGSSGAGIGGGSGGVGGSITINGGTLTVTGGSSSAGIGGGSSSSGGTVNITGGTVTTTGGASGAGIGGGLSGTGGNINISGGTVTATGGSNSAGIGGGGTSGIGGAVSITGGVITANGTGTGSGIGGGASGVAGTINSINGNAVIFASSVQPALPAGGNLGPAIVYIGNNGTMYGNVSLSRNVTIPSGRILSIRNGQTLAIQSGNTLTNNGTIYIENGGNTIGTIAVNQPLVQSLMISGNSAYTYTRGVLNITGDGFYTISMKNGVTSSTVDLIEVSPGVAADIVLINVKIPILDITGATVYITLIGENVVRIHAPAGSTFVVTDVSTGTLTSSSIFFENFEGSTHSFTIVNGSQTNQWHVGTAIAAGGSKSAYISNDGGTSNAYTITTSSIVHMHRNVTFPVSNQPYVLTFQWRAQGEGTSTLYDYLRVRLVETSTTLTAGSQPSSGSILGTYNLGGTGWNQATINIPASNSGTTKRLVFTWVNDSSAGTQPPIAIDNIELR